MNVKTHYTSGWGVDTSRKDGPIDIPLSRKRAAQFASNSVMSVMN